MASKDWRGRVGEHEIRSLWRRQGGGGAVMANRHGTLLAAFNTRHWLVSDSAADEKAGMHAVVIGERE
jgi:hypothetical protein